eukprot:13015271-Alexandrium_andersonii.AAC.1
MCIRDSCCCPTRRISPTRIGGPPARDEFPRRHGRHAGGQQRQKTFARTANADKRTVFFHIQETENRLKTIRVPKMFSGSPRGG